MGPNAHDDLKSSVPKTEPVDQSPRGSGLQGPPRWEPPPGVRHEHPRHTQEQDYNRNSQELEMENRDARGDMYR